MAECFDILVGQQFRQFIASPDRRHRGDRIEFAGAFFDRT